MAMLVITRGYSQFWLAMVEQNQPIWTYLDNRTESWEPTWRERWFLLGSRLGGGVEPLKRPYIIIYLLVNSEPGSSTLW